MKWCVGPCLGCGGAQGPGVTTMRGSIPARGPVGLVRQNLERQPLCGGLQARLGSDSGIVTFFLCDLG